MRSRAPLLFLVTAACSGGEPMTPPSTDASLPTGPVSYEEVQAIWDRTCAGSTCHIGAATPQQELDLSAARSYELLVDFDSAERPELKRVVPGRPNDSYLYGKLVPGVMQINGAPMPSGSMLTAVEADMVRRWIEQGARPPASYRPDAGVDLDSGVPPDAGVVPDRTAPRFNGLTRLRAIDENMVEVTWAEAADDRTAAAQIVYGVYVAESRGAQDFMGTPAASVTGRLTTRLTGLRAGKTYFVVVRAGDEAGNVDGNRAEMQVTTPDQTDPVFAGARRAASPGAGRITVEWDAGSDNVDTAAQLRYRVYRATSQGGEDFTRPVLTTAAGARRADFTGLPMATRYFFVVRAVDRANNEEQNTVEVDAATPDTQAPVFTGARTATASPSAVTVSWMPAMDNASDPSAIVYLLYASTRSRGQSFATPSARTTPGALMGTIGGLMESTRYFVVVRAMDEAMNTDANTVEVSVTTPAAVDRAAPTFAGAAAARAVSQSEIELSWAAASDTVTPAAGIGYLVYQASSAGGETFAAPTVETTPGATSQRITGLRPNTRYFFVVRARDQAGNVDTNRVEVSATTDPDRTAPSFGGIQSAMLMGTNAALLSWNAAMDDATPEAELVYLVYRASGGAAIDFSSAPEVTAPGARSFTASNLAANTLFTFAVRVRDAAGNADTNTQTMTVMTPVPVNMPPVFAGLATMTAETPTTIRLTWTAATDDTTPQGNIVYLIYRSNMPNVPTFSPTYTTPAGATSFLMTGLDPRFNASRTYYVVVRARDMNNAVDTNTVERSAVTPAATVSFTGQIQPLFTRSCAWTTCHPRVAPEPVGARGLSLFTAAISWGGLVSINVEGMPSVQCPNVLRVAKNDPDNSYLMWKLLGPGPWPCFDGVQMPNTTTMLRPDAGSTSVPDPLTPAEIDLVRTWIREGALQN